MMNGMLDTVTGLELIDSPTEDGMTGKYLTFHVDDGDYGVEISCVTEIIEMQDITPVPQTPHYIKGITNLRGTITPVIDLRLRFGHDEAEYTDHTCVIVLSMNDISVGIIVDEVQDVAVIEDESIQPPPKSTGNAIKNYFVKAIGTYDGYVKQLLDIDKVFEIGNSAEEQN